MVQPNGRNPYNDLRNWRTTLVKEAEFIHNRSTVGSVWPRPEHAVSHGCFRAPAFGDRVTIRGSRTRSEHNGSSAEVVSAVDAEGFVVVRLTAAAAALGGVFDDDASAAPRLKVRLDRLRPVGGSDDGGSSRPSIGLGDGGAASSAASLRSAASHASLGSRSSSASFSSGHSGGGSSSRTLSSTLSASALRSLGG